jgi:uncharacterized protein
MKFIIIHGSYGSPQENWFPYLKKKLERQKQVVVAPEFPIDNWEEITKNGSDKPPTRQNLENWLAVFEEKVLKDITVHEKPVIVSHSLGPLFALHVISKYKFELKCAVFVCPFLRKLNTQWQIDYVNQSFYKTDFDFTQLRKLIPYSVTVYSDNDPYVDRKYSREFAKKMGSIEIVVKDGKHLNAEAGFRKFPLVFELCRANYYYPKSSLFKK